MIRINLLPADLRRGNRVSPKVLAACFGAALAVSGAVGWFGLVYFGDLGDAEENVSHALPIAHRARPVCYGRRP